MVQCGGGQSITDSVILLPIFLPRLSHRHWTSTRTVQLLFKVWHVAECRTCLSGTMWQNMAQYVAQLAHAGVYHAAISHIACEQCSQCILYLAYLSAPNRC